MAENTNISWARHTFNGWIGCTKVSPACKNCYAERDWDHRFHRVKWGPSGARSITGSDNWKKPLQWDKAARWAGEVHTVFCNSLSDVMDDHPSIQQSWRNKLFRLIHETTIGLEWLILTKRPENWAKFLPSFEHPFPNVRLGISVEDQEWADMRAPYLKAAHNFGWKTFVSYGPACGSVNWNDLMPYIGWLVSEGESGPKARPSHPDWFREARDACARAGVPFHHKQNGEWAPMDGYEEWTPDPEPPIHHWPGGQMSARVGLRLSGRLLDGVLHDGFPS